MFVSIHLGTKVSTASVYIYLFLTNFLADWGEKAASVLNVDDFARSLLGDITDNPDIRRSETSIVLIGHSMGGIVIKKVTLSVENKCIQITLAGIHLIKARRDFQGYCSSHSHYIFSRHTAQRFGPRPDLDKYPQSLVWTETLCE
jgi:triacylglycerol esterase/lipase EstA (alpha/beta hydrolase family)